MESTPDSRQKSVVEGGAGSLQNPFKAFAVGGSCLRFENSLSFLGRWFGMNMALTCPSTLLWLAASVPIKLDFVHFA